MFGSLGCLELSDYVAGLLIGQLVERADVAITEAIEFTDPLALVSVGSDVPADPVEQRDDEALLLGGGSVGGKVTEHDPLFGVEIRHGFAIKHRHGLDRR